MNDQYEVLARYIKKAERVMVLTGAGMSTESGLLDFRGSKGSTGMWIGKDPMQIASVKSIQPRQKGEDKTSYRSRLAEFIQFYAWRMKEVKSHEPNKGHHILAKWYKKKHITHLVTQNVDGYHQRAGNGPVHAIHGNLMELRCNVCGHRHGISRYLSGDKETDYFCRMDGGFLRPGIVLFGEELPGSANIAFNLAKQCDLIIVMGSSLQVSPANHLTLEVLSHGGKLVIINNEPTAQDGYADLVIQGSISNALTQTDRILEGTT
jgi:NAD-dependent deacetylase